MKYQPILAAILVTALVLCVVAIIEAPRKPEREKVYVLPRVEEMPTDPTPFDL